MGDEILVMGQAPGRTHPDVTPQQRRVVKFLADLVGITPVEFCERCDFVNLLSCYHGKAGKGDCFPPDVARAAASIFDPSPWSTIVMLGKNVPAAFGLRRDYFIWQMLSETRVAVFPHPSGVNRWWNDASNKRSAVIFLRSLLAADPPPDGTGRHPWPGTGR